jgi:hypothetical protein
LREALSIVLSDHSRRGAEIVGRILREVAEGLWG